MQADNFWTRFAGTAESGDLDDLRRDMILILATILLVIGWAITLAAIGYDGRWEYLPAGAVLILGASLGLALRQDYFRVTRYWLVAVLLGALVGLKWFLPESLAQYYYPVAIVAASLLISGSRVLGVACIASIACVVVARIQGASWFDPLQIVNPVALIFLTAFTAWLNSHQVNTVLDWMEKSYHHARELLEQLRDERMALARTLKSLEDAYVRIEKMNYALIEAHRVAEEARQFKAEFVANVSHELRTPLNLIIGFTEMMTTAPESYGDVLLPSAYRGDMLATYRNARHLHALIDDVLDLSRIDAGNMPINRELLDLGQVIHEAAEMVRGLVEARGLTLKLELPDDTPKLQIDRTRIRQVVLNLLTNATRFTDAGTIRVQTHSEESEVIVTVEDSGRGIEPARLTQAFEAFTQLESGQAHQGSGLGLAVSKRFVELHGGRMEIESELGRGTRVNFSLPLPSTGTSGQRSRWIPSRMQPSSNGEPMVIVMHDDLRVLPLLRRYVNGYQFQLAETPDKLRAIIQASMPAAVIMDSGGSIANIQNAAGLGLPQDLLVIRCPLPSARRLGALVGAADFVSKPLSREDLSLALTRLPQPQSILVVDDDPDFVRLAERMLKADYPSVQILQAFGGKPGLELARAEQPDLVLLDLAMPDLDGYAFLEALAEDEAMAKTKIIIVSASSLEHEDAPLTGEFSLTRECGFSLTEVLRALQVSLATVTTQSATVQANAAESPRV